MTGRRPGPPTSRCPKCGAQILWWRSMTRENKSLPIDPSPDSDHGSIRKVVRTDGGPLAAQVLSVDEIADAIANGELLFVHHRQSCNALRPVNPRPASVRLDLPTHRSRRRERPR